MKLSILALSVLSASLFKVCESSDEGGPAKAELSAEGKAAAKAEGKADARVTPRIGGSLVAVGDRTVELKLFKRGLVEALVFEADGKLAAAPADMKLGVSATAQGGAKENIALSWNAPRLRFTGKAKGKAELVPGPVSVSLTIDGKTAKAEPEVVVLLVGPEAGGRIVAAGHYSAELSVGADGKVAALVRNAAGVRVRKGLKAKVKARLTGAGGAKHDVALKFDPPTARFVGRVGAGVKIVPGPVQFIVEADGKAHVGALAHLALRAEATHGGRVALVGDYSVEVAADGKQVAAFVADASGKAHVKGDLDLKLHAGADFGHAVKLEWHPPSASYRAELNADVDLAAEPFRIVLEADGRAFVGAVGRLQGAARLAGAGKVGASAKGGVRAKANVKAPSVKAKAGAKASVDKSASASANVRAPKVEVKKSAGATAGGKAKAGFSFGTK